MKNIALLLSAAALAGSGVTVKPVMLGSHEAKYAPDGSLRPWTSWRDAVDREMKWYLNAPIEHSYPRFVWMTFMNDGYQPESERSLYGRLSRDGITYAGYRHVSTFYPLHRLACPISTCSR